MLSSLQTSPGLDREALEHVFTNAADGGGAEAFRRPTLALEVDDLLMEADGRTLPDFAAFTTAFMRSARTIAPLALSDVMALTFSGTLAWLLVSHLFHSHASALPPLALFALLPLVLAAYLFSGLYWEIWVHPVVEMRQMTLATTFSLMGAAAGGAALMPVPLWCLAAWPLAVVLTPLMRTCVRYLAARRHAWGFPTLIIGSGQAADQVVRSIMADPRCGLRPVLMTDPQREEASSTLPVINDAPTLHSILRANAIQHAVISLPEVTGRRLTETLNAYSALVPHLLVLSDPSTLPMLWSASRHGQLSGMEIRNQRLLWTVPFIKRVMDVCLGAMALLATAPIFIAAAIMVKATSPGPLFYGHTRAGRRGRMFKVWKFRTMHVDGKRILAEHLRSHPEAKLEWEANHKLREDPRVTRFGALLRKTSIDELPQIWNVLRGEMSLVGPRPIIREEVWRYGDSFRLYALVKPGITGLWQVSGRNDVDYDDRVRLDEFYVRHWSPWLDIHILARTVVVLLERSGAY